MPKEGVEFAFMFEQVSSPEHETKCFVLLLYCERSKKLSGSILDGPCLALSYSSCLSVRPMSL